MNEPLQPKAERVFFHGLNELRGLAALAVLFNHIELYKERDGLASLYQGRVGYFISHLGKNGVFLFFVLSGFLITYLLLEELRRTGTIYLRGFYLRRILRIWPLYFLILALSFGIVPLLRHVEWLATERHYLGRIAALDFGLNLVLHLVFLSNLALLLFPGVVGAAQTWSVSVEEQFYAIWPLLLRTSGRRPWLMLLGVIVASLTAPLFVVWLNVRFFSRNAALTVLSRFLEGLRFELMAIGGLAAWCLFTWPELVRRLCSGRALLIGLITLLTLQLFVFSLPLLIGLTCAGLLLHVISQRISFAPLDWLGRISYGVYMFHPLAMFIGFGLAHHHRIVDGAWSTAFEYFLIVGITLAISVLSHRYLEQPFLRRKARYSVVPSG